MIPNTRKSPITEDSAVFNVDRLDILHVANDNQLTAHSTNGLARLRQMSPVLAFTIGFSAAGLIVALETSRLFAGG